ncbi:MAG: hypothetical protein M0Z46_12455 [Actinomycetota bacterium]|jgi:hypothetical protein|nr:hypothetical protein [Actinomycetota bacterium]
MERGFCDVDGLLKELRARRGVAWIKAVTGPPVEGVAQLLHALIVVGPRPAGRQERTWAYNECSFASSGITVGRLGA